MPDGSKVCSLIDQLNAALRDAGVARNSFGEKYSVYSLRHFYAVMALRNGIGVFEVARNMGTSVQIIQEYYGKQATSAVFATRLGD
jgi:integrase